MSHDNNVFLRQSVKIRSLKRENEALLAERAALLARIEELKGGEPVMAILATPDWIDDIRAAADVIDAPVVGLIGCDGCPGCPNGQCQKLKEGKTDVTQR